MKNRAVFHRKRKYPLHLYSYHRVKREQGNQELQLRGESSLWMLSLIDELASVPITSSQTDKTERAILDQSLEEQESVQSDHIQVDNAALNTPTLQQFLCEQAESNGM